MWKPEFLTARRYARSRAAARPDTQAKTPRSARWTGSRTSSTHSASGRTESQYTRKDRPRQAVLLLRPYAGRRQRRASPAPARQNRPRAEAFPRPFRCRPPSNTLWTALSAARRRARPKAAQPEAPAKQPDNSCAVKCAALHAHRPCPAAHGLRQSRSSPDT